MKETGSRRGLVRPALSLLLAVLTFAALLTPAFTAQAAAKPAIRFSAEYSASNKSLNVTVSVNGQGSALSSGMFAVEYDPARLKSDRKNPATASKIISVGMRNDVDNDRICLEWYTENGIPKSSGYVDIASLAFTVSGGGIKDLSEVLWLCTDSVYLDRLGGYGKDGGALLCRGNDSWSVGAENLAVEWQYESGVHTVRLGGADRYETAAKIAENGWPNGSRYVVIASASGYVDALAGVPLASALDAPILLVSGSSLKTSIKNRLKALAPEKAYILGGTSAVSSSVEKAIKNTGVDVERISGSDRYETAVRIAEKLADVNGRGSSSAFFAYAYNYPDALAVSSVAAVSGTPILYAPGSGSLDKKTAAYIKRAGITSAAVLGGTSAVGASVVNSIKANGVISVTRVSGDDRYATALAICKKYDLLFEGSDIALATGTSYPDALAGGALAAKYSIPVILVGKDMDTKGIKSYISGKNYKNVYIFGGTSAVPQKYVDSLIDL